MTRDEALVLLRSGQMPVSRYVQLCDQNGWEQFGLGTHLLAEAGNALDDKDAEIERLRAVNEKHHNDIKMLGRTAEEQAATIADLTAALQFYADQDFPTGRVARAALARAQGGKE